MLSSNLKDTEFFVRMISVVVVLLIASFVAGQSAREFFCEFKSDGVFEQNVEQSLLHLNEGPFIYFDDCEDALKKGFTLSGVYRIKPKSSFRPFQVWCDMESESGGWTLIQVRYDGLTDFFRNWVEYRNGFGRVDGDHWLGNNFIHQLTENNDYQLKIEVTGFQDNEFAFAKYSPFHIGSEDENYRLYIGNFSSEGQISDSLSSHNGSMFSTKDNDNDDWPANCAERFKGAWWYRGCYQSNLNGIWMSKQRSIAVRGPQTVDNEIGINFRNVFNVYFYSLKSVEMKVKKLRRT
ncbi:microfibril-associated glycoprotein 4-like [Bradysia coprophila]|uniref:microfibril-associated glycoprotein 4-like n=2 Tax=Bradysia coprophila TaxID=38358 RepID=UPI00187DA610|nr:microfibril-associated glycoprotein 4-like [Bradysia coprophila]